MAKFANYEESSSHPKPTTQTSESSVLDELVNRYSGELPGSEPNLEKAFEIASEEVILEDPQQQPEQRPESPNQTLKESYQEQILVGQHVSQTSIEQITELDFMITSDHSDGKDEQTNSWFKPGFLNKSTNSSSIVVLKSVPDQPSETITKIADPEPFTTDQPSSSNQALQTCTSARTTKVPSPPTLFLDSTILEDVCENIFQ